MQPVSAKYAAAIVESHKIWTRVEVWAGFGTSRLASLNIETGSMTEDVANTIRRQLTLGLVDTDGTLIPSLTGTLTPYGNEIFAWSGIDYQDGTYEEFPVGVFPITDADFTLNTSTLSIALVAKDRANTVSRAKLTDYYVIIAGTDVATAIKTLIQSRVPSLTNAYFNFTPTTGFTTPLIVLKPGDDPWAQSQTIAASAGCDLYFDQNGICTLVTTPNPQTTPNSWTYNVDAGSADSILSQMTRKLTQQGVTNHVIVLASGTGITTPLRADATDNNPASPTYIGGPYGDVPVVINSTTATTLGQCQAAATSALNQALGLAATGSLGGIPNPAQLANDVVTLKSSRIGYTTQAVVLDSLTIPLTFDGTLSGSFRLVAGR